MLNHKGTITIETSRLILRRARAQDAEAMFRNWANDSEVTKYLTWPPHESVELTRTLLERWSAEYEKEDYYHWMIVLKEIGEPIGSLLVSTVGRAQSAHIGYCIGKRWWQKRKELPKTKQQKISQDENDKCSGNGVLIRQGSNFFQHKFLRDAERLFSFLILSQQYCVVNIRNSP